MIYVAEKTNLKFQKFVHPPPIYFVTCTLLCLFECMLALSNIVAADGAYRFIPSNKEEQGQFTVASGTRGIR